MVRLRCASCHSAEPAPILAQVGARKTREALRARLLAGHFLASERDSKASDLAQFLASLGGPLEPRDITVDLGDIERGRQLFHTIGCVACHTPQEPAEDLEFPLWTAGYESALSPALHSDLGQLGRSTNIDALAQFLVDPLAAFPSGRMPSMRVTESEARALASYLLRQQAGPREAQPAPGWSCELFDGESASGVPYTTIPVSDLTVLPPHPQDHFALRMRGFLEIERSGRYEFTTRSDDGSMLYIDGQLVVDNGGVHAPAEKSGALTLERGLHGVLLTFFDEEGGEELSLTWRPPDGENGPIPARLLSHSELRFWSPGEIHVPDGAAIERGRRAYAELGCEACHPLEGVKSTAKGPRPLAELGAHAGRGCLAEQPDGRAPRFAFDAQQRAELRALLGDLPTACTEKERLDATLARLNCLACHARDGRGGPSEELRPYFRAAVEADLGNEGRLPPRLDDVGSKLHAAWMEKVLVEGALERPYLATRMPQYGAANVAGLGELFERVDGSPADMTAPVFTSERAEQGRKLAGAGGLSCIQCHVFDGVPSLGIPAVDLAHVRERIKPAWFEKLLLDPKSLGMNTRMPIFWDAQGISTARTILDGDPRLQAEALWSYVSLGRSMPLPDGLVVPDAEYELTPTKDAVLCGVFLKNASPRSLLVGHPELVHYAFDLENTRMVCAWRGRFFNARGTWDGRAGGLEWPKSDELLEFERAPALAFLAAPDAPWPSEFGRAAGFRRLGTRYDAHRRPTFRYELRGIEVAESCVPLVRPGAPGLLRTFDLKSSGTVEDLYLRAVPGRAAQHVPFSKASDGTFAAHVEVEVTW